MPCVFWSTGWGVVRITTGEIVEAMNLPPGIIAEEFSRAAVQSKVLLTSYLKLPPVKALKFSLAVGLGIGRTVIPNQKNNSLMPLHPVYTLRYENLFRLNL